MDVFDLFAKISLDSSEYEKGLKNAKSSASGLTGLFGKVGSAASTVGKGIFNVATNVAKVSVAATTAGAAAVSALTTLAVNSYADYEQLVGGVETLYKTSADKVQQYAADAYKTAGLSANEYMNTATTFAAALVSSLGGDTEQAAELANTAIGDMSDNANKMGTDMESIQNAYNGFSKQNYTMLDNLKLGYGGTKQEMQRLLDDANKLNAAQGNYTKYSIDSYADVVSAIHDVQNAMGITGTTSKEASTTIQGSVNATKSAWSNLVTGIADDNANFEQLISNFVDSATTAASNILPRIEAALNGAAKLIESLVPPIMAELPSLIETVLPQLAQSAVNIVQTLVTGISANAAQLIDSAIQIITVLGNGIYQMLPTVAQSALQIVLTLVSKLNENLPQMLDTAGQMLIAFVEGVSEHLPDIMLAAASIVETLLTYFIEHLPDIVEGAMQMGDAVIDGIIDGISAAWDSLVSWFNGLWDNLFGNRSVNVDVNSSGTDGSHAGGLDYVPYNNYVANLHRGEMVLTSEEATQYRKGNENAAGGMTFNININGIQFSDVNSMAHALANQISYELQAQSNRKAAVYA
ncbi:phage tail protein [Gemmiger sp.]|uniref:phage tail protein n=2 Tax=Bacteria TaxID=2 RepID=UPI003AB81564